MCHGGDGNGGEMGPGIAVRLSALDNAQLTTLIRGGRVEKGMPPIDLPDAELTALLSHLRTLQRRQVDVPVVRRTVALVDGRTIEGRLLGEGFRDLQLRPTLGRWCCCAGRANGSGA